MICTHIQGSSKLNWSTWVPALSRMITLIDQTVPVVIVTRTSVRVPLPLKVQLLSATRALSPSRHHLQDARRDHVTGFEEPELHPVAGIDLEVAGLAREKILAIPPTPHDDSLVHFFLVIERLIKPRTAYRYEFCCKRVHARYQKSFESCSSGMFRSCCRISNRSISFSSLQERDPARFLGSVTIQPLCYD
jgi:hypothetical protein